MEEMFQVIRKGSRVTADYPTEYEDLFRETFASVKDEVRKMPAYGQTLHVRAVLKAIREEEQHLMDSLSENDFSDYERVLLRKRSEARAEAEKTGEPWSFNEEEAMIADGWASKQIKQWKDRQKMREALALLGARRVSYEMVSAHLARWGEMPSKKEANKESEG